ncbi:Kiwa anti-phage protein KwaB-like domain-containing protein [Mycobacteroides abscessus]|uniref:Kiwa anti-phage protein KwaB-like domain-containing protein n=1 Tax=Mycobacteroides abscessus TaxID=36809 RepID=UPI0009A7105A|nr:Kiwa anti-phage protein KwaB-like domain-containing protein [Mycobacteroides abscessus]MDO3067179.1 DUF4868 domain-containing protein [Mycobacteroides abscessus subsp. bolletii]SKN24222.1 Uncharacterised protein [Mycobacteroides abscessus subsp. bolletii]SKX01872.1 Uncharacterised protein [Mycobacteroides abscessus subsp. bolletii]
MQVNWSAVQLREDSMALLVGWRDQNKGLQAVRLEPGRKLSEELRQIAVSTIANIAELQPLPYQDTASLVDGEEYFTYRLETDQPTDNGNKATIPEADGAGAQLNQLISDPISLDTCTAQQLRDGTFLFYACVFHSNKGQHVACVKIQQQLRLASANRLFATLGEQLNYVTNPIFAFSKSFDLIVKGSDIAILSPNAFERLFTDLDLLTEAMPGHIETLSSQLNLNLEESTLETLLETCVKRRSIAKLVRKLSSRDYLETVTVEAISSELDKYPELNEDVTIIDGSISFSDKGAKTFLYILEQRFWAGPFDKRTRQATTYRELQ